jgi:hypothetical protein
MLQRVGGGSRCGCNGFRHKEGGYKATKKNLNTLRRYNSGRSIGFTARSSLKAKGLIPRSSGQYVLGPKYSGTRKSKIIHARSAIRRVRSTRK